MPVSELVVGVIEGRIDFAELQHRFERGIYKMMFAFVKDPADAEEVTERVFVRVFEQLLSYDPRRSSFGRWLYTIAYNMAMSYFRERRRAPESLEVMTESEQPSVAGPDELFEARVLRAKLFMAMRKLSPIERGAFIGFRVAQLPWKVVAAEQCCTERAAQYHCRAAIRKLRESL
jgi:RNA polymerase sigma-70 factor (ECF subfamily)